jgi:hypothetical protein
MEDLNTIVIEGTVVNPDFAEPLPEHEDEFNFMILHEHEGQELKLRVRVGISYLAAKCKEQAYVGARVVVVGQLCTEDLWEFPLVDAFGVTVSER